MESNFRIAELIVRKIKGEITSGEEAELSRWLVENPDNQAFYNRIASSRNNLEKLETYKLFNSTESWAKVHKRIAPVKRILLVPQKVLKYAAIIILPIMLIGGLSYYIYQNSSAALLAKIDEKIHPGDQKATLILADGQEINLESEQSQTKIKQGKKEITNEGKTLSYAEDENLEEVEPLVYNEVRTPRGGRYQLILSDGTQVWLNAGSSIRYPVSFTDSIRQVYLQGEGYFKVSHREKPFVVVTHEADIRVLGTSFNISAYSNDESMKTTLVEGKVLIELPDDMQETSVVLDPNDQAVLDKSDQKLNVLSVNTAYYTSWIMGKLEFNNESLEEVMRKLARWYDFEYRFEKEKARDYHFTARLDSKENISTILEMIQLTGKVNFKLKENTIIIL